MLTTCIQDTHRVEAPGQVGDRGWRQLAVILVGHPKLRNDLKRPLMEETGDPTTVFELGGLRNRQREFTDEMRAAELPF